MNNNTEQITSYLQNEMTAAEKAAFENRLSTEPALQQEVNAQKQIIQAAINAGIKNEFAKAMHTKRKPGKTIYLAWLAAACVVAIVVFNFRDTLFPGKGKVDVSSITENIRSFINPPLAAINVPFTEFSFDAEKGDTFYYRSGSVIIFPPAALIDASGKAVTGEVKVRYREFADPLDFFVSGIPMAYDSGAVKYNFESSGMCEINAFQAGQALFINKDSKPEIHLSVSNKDPKHNLYFLDTVNRRWEFMGKDRITQVTVPGKLKVNTTAALPEMDANLPVKPVKPAMTDIDKQAFSVEVDPAAFEELQAYNGLKFQVEDESTYRASDANEQWRKVDLERTSTEGIYNITFSNASRKVTYKVRPVIDGEDYDAALKVFDQKNQLYQQALQNRLVKEKIINDSIRTLTKKMQDKMNAEQAWNEKINNMILERNKKLREIKKRPTSDTLKTALEEEVLAMDAEMRTEINKKYAEDLNMSSEVVRSFVVNRFGVWNCDCPVFSSAIPISVNFRDSEGNPIAFANVAVVYGSLNGLSQFDGTMVRVLPGKQNMLWAILDRKFYYFTYKDFAGSGIDSKTKNFTFMMRSTAKKVSSYDEVKDLAGKL